MITVHAVSIEQFIPSKAAHQGSLRLRVYNIEFVWKADELFRYACGQNPGCGLYLHHLTYRYVDCPAEAGPCSECQEIYLYQ